MRKLLLILVILFLGFTLASCKDEEDSLPDGEVITIQNPNLVEDLIDEIKGVFED